MTDAIDISPDKDGKLLKKIIKEGVGNGCPPNGCKVKVHYTGTLLDGTQFDSSRDRNDPFVFDLGKGNVIKGWDLGVATMKKGEQALLTIASEYAYGKAGSPPNIPPDSTLNFDIEVLDWTYEDLSPQKDGGVERVVTLKTGEGFSTPNDGAIVEVHIVGKYENTIFEEIDVTFTLGEGSEKNVVKGVEIAIGNFKKGETSVILVKSEYAYGTEGNKTLNIPSNASLEYTLTLKSFEKAKESWSIDSSERINQAELFKTKGTNYFKNEKYELAIKLYKKIETFLSSDKDVKDDHYEKRRTLLLASHLNVCLVELKRKNYFEAKVEANSALEYDPKNDKALYRRGQAYLGLSEPALASKDFAKCLEIDPSNKAAQTQQTLCAKLLKEQLQKEKKIYANMFDKFAKTDTQREENENKKVPNVLSSVGEWGQEDREREPSEFEKENPNILMLNGTGEFKDM